MSELTEKLKLGILRDGLYYFRMPDGDVDISDNYELMRLKYTEDGHKIEVLAEIPTYEEWQDKLLALDAAHKTIKMEDETINRLVRSCKQCNCENAQLKELLKECREVLKMVAGETINFPRTVDECIEKINLVLGEDK